MTIGPPTSALFRREALPACVAGLCVALSSPRALAAPLEPLEGRDRVDVPESSPQCQEEQPDERRPPSFGLDASQQGRVTYSGLRVNLPLSPRVSVLTVGALLRVGPSVSGDSATFNPYIGGGMTYAPFDRWSFELTGMVGPTSFNIGSLGATFVVSRTVGGDWAIDEPPRLEITAEVSGTRFQWGNNQGPAGQTLAQGYLNVTTLIRLGSRWELTPKGMFFVYDRSLETVADDRLDGLGVLARVGSFAPRVLGGVRLAYNVTRWLRPFAEADEIVYAVSIGDATRLTGGASFKVGKDTSFLLGGGVLYNRLGRGLASSRSEGAVPVALGELETSF